jgi:hypothetical protein
MNPGKKENFRAFGAWCVLVYAVLVWVLLADQWLSFPLGEKDQLRVAWLISGSDSPPAGESWVADLLDPILAWVSPHNPYPVLQGARRLFATVALVGMVVWVCRAGGWIKGIWVAVLVLGFLPVRLASIGLAPQAFCLALLVWGFALTLGPPWSKTGSVELFGGGALLGAAAFAAPWGWLYTLAVPIHTACSKTFRRNLEGGFWWGLLAGLIPGLLWLVQTPSSKDLGIHLESVRLAKLGETYALLKEGWGGPFLLCMAAGICSIRKKGGRWPAWGMETTWPLLPTILLGHADPVTTCLAFPGLLFFALAGLERIGKFFVNRTEQIAIPSLVVLLLGYHLYFSGLIAVRAQQGFSIESGSLALLITERVPPGSPVALFRLDPILSYLNALHPDRSWKSVPAKMFLGPKEDVPDLLRRRYGKEGEIWVDPKRLSEMDASPEIPLLGTLQGGLSTDRFVGPHGVEIWRFRLDER